MIVSTLKKYLAPAFLSLGISVANAQEIEVSPHCPDTMAQRIWDNFPIPEKGEQLDGARQVYKSLNPECVDQVIVYGRQLHEAPDYYQISPLIRYFMMQQTRAVHANLVTILLQLDELYELPGVYTEGYTDESFEEDQKAELKHYERERSVEESKTRAENVLWGLHDSFIDEVPRPSSFDYDCNDFRHVDALFADTWGIEQITKKEAGEACSAEWVHDNIARWEEHWAWERVVSGEFGNYLILHKIGEDHEKEMERQKEIFFGYKAEKVLYVLTGTQELPTTSEGLEKHIRTLREEAFGCVDRIRDNEGMSRNDVYGRIETCLADVESCADSESQAVYDCSMANEKFAVWRGTGRENEMIYRIATDGWPMAPLILGGGHYLGDNVEEWNDNNSDHQIGLIVITPEAYHD